MHPRDIAQVHKRKKFKMLRLRNCQEIHRDGFLSEPGCGAGACDTLCLALCMTVPTQWRRTDGVQLGDRHADSWWPLAVLRTVHEDYHNDRKAPICRLHIIVLHKQRVCISVSVSWKERIPPRPIICPSRPPLFNGRILNFTANPNSPQSYYAEDIILGIFGA